MITDSLVLSDVSSFGFDIDPSTLIFPGDYIDTEGGMVLGFPEGATPEIISHIVATAKLLRRPGGEKYKWMLGEPILPGFGGDGGDYLVDLDGGTTNFRFGDLVPIMLPILDGEKIVRGRSLQSSSAPDPKSGAARSIAFGKSLSVPVEDVVTNLV